MSGKDNTLQIEKQVYQELLRKLDENFRKYFSLSVRYYTQIQLTKIYHREPSQTIENILNQVLEVALKNDQIKKNFIEVIIIICE